MLLQFKTEEKPALWVCVFSFSIFFDNWLFFVTLNCFGIVILIGESEILFKDFFRSFLFYRILNHLQRRGGPQLLTEKMTTELKGGRWWFHQNAIILLKSVCELFSLFYFLFFTLLSIYNLHLKPFTLLVSIIKRWEKVKNGFQVINTGEVKYPVEVSRWQLQCINEGINTNKMSWNHS